MSKGTIYKLRPGRGRVLYEPERVTASSVIRGRHLDPEAVTRAAEWRRNRIKELESKPILSLSFKEQHELQRLKAGR
jgi:hypothetical protein